MYLLLMMIFVCHNMESVLRILCNDQQKLDQILQSKIKETIKSFDDFCIDYRDEITAGAEVLMQKIKMYRPKIVAFNGRGIYEVYAGNKHFHYGKQPDLFLGTDTVSF